VLDRSGDALDVRVVRMLDRCLGWFGFGGGEPGGKPCSYRIRRVARQVRHGLTSQSSPSTVRVGVGVRVVWGYNSEFFVC
jgi:hypothetical protein